MASPPKGFRPRNCVLRYANIFRTRAGGRATCEGFIAFKDPTGNQIELVWRPAYSSRRYHGERDAGITGFSHIGLCTTDAARDGVFWTKVCNARVSDRIGDARSEERRVGKEWRSRRDRSVYTQ